MGLSRDARVGFLATLIICVVGQIISLVTSAQQQKNWGTPYHIIFNRVEGIEEGTKVFYNGRLVGRVRNLEVQSIRDDGVGLDVPMRADITISISPLYTASVILTRESRFQIEGGLWGERWIGIQYEPGEAVPSGGAVKGESVPAFTHLMRHGVQNLDWFHEIVDAYRKQIGGGEKARQGVKAAIRDWNDLAFDLRVQANKFNQFSGLIEERLGKAADDVDARIVAFRSRGAITVSQMHLYARAMEQAALQQSRHVSAIVARLQAQMGVLQAGVRGLDAYVAGGDRLVEDLFSAARARVKEAEDMVAALRFVSKNPALASRIRAIAASMRQGSAELRATIDSLRRQIGARERMPGAVPSQPLPRGTEGGGATPEGIVAPGVPQAPLPLQSRPPEPPPTPGPQPTGH